MQTSVLSSTALLTVLLAIGLIFFIRASTKARIQVVQLVTEQEEEPLLQQLEQYFTQRAYRIVAVDAAHQQVTFEGLVRPSVFLAVFLTTLAAIGTLCLALVLALLFPAFAAFFPILLAIAPIAGIFYWRKSARPERVTLQVQPFSATPASTYSAAAQSLLTVTGHRDELAELQQSFNLKQFEAESA
ncbi:cofactor assembly of complex C subunit B [Oculatella sp. LEGE 06141]|uniref:cofactor assembly of complex C subunit B n=1 Tax=Oculatella sp. LEGE 06141 TaxID=1828648 RepID=UPI001882F2F5|nr:cofactor assembly of complex C subunit B [Oculatella sp. LEGE 06141]MBE9180841.1 cofactor assembly of complex C subunit B [Oculatella sp. LEGE 06141]